MEKKINAEELSKLYREKCNKVNKVDYTTWLENLLVEFVNNAIDLHNFNEKSESCIRKIKPAQEIRKIC